MKKKIFSFLAVALFMTSYMNGINQNEDPTNDCAAEAFNLQGDMEDSGVPKHIANEWANEFYEFCVDYMESQGW